MDGSSCSIIDEPSFVVLCYNSANDRLTETKAVDKTDGTTELAKNTYSYNGEDLTGITAGVGNDTVNYSFAYDTFGNQQNVKVGTQGLITNTYAARNGVLASSLYGNSDTVTYTYDGYDRIKGIKYNGDTNNRYEYFYNADGKLARTVDRENDITYTYLYDVIGRPVSCTGTDGTKINYAFDNFNKSTRTQYYWDGVRKTTAFSYDSAKDNALKTTTFSNGSTLTNTIDGFGRVAYKTLNVGSNSFTHYLNFMHLSETRTSNEVARLYYRKGEDEYLSVLDYKYDVNGNITKIYDRPFTSHWPTESDTPTVSYEYDQLNQLTHEVNGYTGETVDYIYDNRGNILSKTITKDGTTDTINYTYGDSNWKDKLTAYDGKTITYDEIGNPLTYDGWTFDWQKGRQLESISNVNTSLSFKYNENGIRTSKIVDGVETKYFLDGSTIVAQKTGNTILWFYYDGNGQLTAMQNGNDGKYYYYVYNYQGDVVALLDSNLEYVANYTYDSWGKLISITGSNTAIGNLNPFRYRGYYYDSETGLYYLNSRYYNPEIGRFINSDTLTNTEQGVLGCNMFAYCQNNPISFVDDNGHALGILAGAFCGGLVGAVGGAFFGAISAGIKGEDMLNGAIAGGVSGAIGGAVAGTLADPLGSALGAVGGSVVAGVIGGATNGFCAQVINQPLNYFLNNKSLKNFKMNWVDVGISTAVNAAVGGIHGFSSTVCYNAPNPCSGGTADIASALHGNSVATIADGFTTCVRAYEEDMKRAKENSKRKPYQV